MTVEFPLDVEACRRRQQRLCEVMRRQEVDLVVLRKAANVQWLTGAHLRWFFEPLAAMDASGLVTLVAPETAPVEAAVDERLAFEAQWHSTLRNDQTHAAAQVLESFLRSRTNSPAPRVGVEYSGATRHLPSLAECETVDLEPAIYRLRRRKEEDELAKIRHAIRATEAMYVRARQIIAPGVSELQVFNELQAAAVESCGEMLTATGNDYQCGSRGGLPRNHRVCEDGELYILDLGPAFRGYFADNCRTVAVGTPSDLQQEAWGYLIAVFEQVETSVQPGKSARELFHEAQTILDQAPCGLFDHHLGHGIGLFPHEAPHLNPNWDDTFEEGDVFTVEPGLYDERLKAGMRIENNYRVTADGVELLTPFPMELK